jgi:hypothetical protein
LEQSASTEPFWLSRSRLATYVPATVLPPLVKVSYFCSKKSVTERNALKHVLRQSFRYTAAVSMQWVLFGSGGHRDRPTEGQLKGFNKCNGILSKQMKCLGSSFWFHYHATFRPTHVHQCNFRCRTLFNARLISAHAEYHAQSRTAVRVYFKASNTRETAIDKMSDSAKWSINSVHFIPSNVIEPPRLRRSTLLALPISRQVY